MIKVQDVVTASFYGDDGRRAEFPLSSLPLPGWIDPIGYAFAARVGPEGTIRTRSAASGIWFGVTSFVNYLSQLPAPPLDPTQLTVTHLRAYESEIRRRYVGDRNLWGMVGRVTSVLQESPVWELLTEDVREYALARRRRTFSGHGLSGYSDGELRRLITRLRQNVAAIRDRVDAGHALVERYDRAPQEVEPDLREQACALAEISRTGVIPDMAELGVTARNVARRRLAMQLFLVPSDLVPISALFIALSDRNVETIKELPSTCRVIEDRAVEVILTKRRRGAGRWFETVSWEIGPPGGDLHYPGGLFLMVQRLTSYSRQFSDAERLWAIWRNGWYRTGVGSVGEHYDPYVTDLQWPVHAGEWAKQQTGLWADSVEGEDRKPLLLDCVRLKKSMEVRRTKHMGGHLPSASRSNTYPVLFASYLRGDATVQAWAEDVTASALTDAEEAAWHGHQDALRQAGGYLGVVYGDADQTALEREGIEPAVAKRIADGEQDAAWTACADPKEHPETGKPCRTPSVLDCFACKNCIVTRHHLPRLLALLHAMQQRRQELSEELWWKRYGSTWVAIRRDIIDGRHFTAAEIDQARSLQADDAMLDLVENPWENNS